MSKFSLHADMLVTAPPFTVSRMVDILHAAPDSGMVKDGWNGDTQLVLRTAAGDHLCRGIEPYPTSRVLLMVCTEYPSLKIKPTDFRTLVGLVKEIAHKQPGSGNWSIQAIQPEGPTVDVTGVHMDDGYLVLETA